MLVGRRQPSPASSCPFGCCSPAARFMPLCCSHGSLHALGGRPPPASARHQAAADKRWTCRCHFAILINRQGKTRLTKWYSAYSTKEKMKIIRGARPTRSLPLHCTGTDRQLTPSLHRAEQHDPAAAAEDVQLFGVARLEAGVQAVRRDAPAPLLVQCAPP